MKVRVTGVVVEDDRILLLDQDTDTGRSWSLPGGKVEEGERLADALAREMREETGVEGADTTPIRGVQFVPLADLSTIGFSSRFVELARAGWPGAGSYMGAKSNLGL
ncbi:NUDIX domain-containing protein [Nonomuraea sp. NPDC051941]|uniref:NUDIX domain-containing protein n=1 Tax=Nonomuraea sp. NPDC051941 TaxID=3364373 RepID=UPI0037C9E2D7